MGIIPQSKQGDCTCCSSKNVPCVKRGKDLICFPCKNAIDNKKQLLKASTRDKERTITVYDNQDGIFDSIQELILDLDRVTSRMVRLAAMEKDGKVQCFTCSSRRDFKSIHCGHFIPRANMVFRFDWIYNLSPQCPTCNISLRGNEKVFADNLEIERPGIVEWMREEARKVYSPSRDELKQLLFDYQKRVSMFEKQKLNQ